MQKRAGHIRRVAEEVLFIGFCVQICIGIIWMVLHFSGSLTATESLFSIAGNEPAAHVWCVCQLLFAGFAAHHLLNTFEIRTPKWHICGMLALLTFPMAMQCHLSLSADSIVNSLLVLLFSEVIRWIRGGSGTKKKLYLRVGILVLITVLLLGIGVTDRRQNSGDNAGERSVYIELQTAMASRFAWSSLQELYGIWQEEIKETVPEQVARETSYYADNVERVLLPWLQQTCGMDEAGRSRISAVLYTISRTALENNTRDICREILWDAAGYGLSPIVLQFQLAGKGYDSYSGILYDNMLRHTPRLSHVYMTYGCRWFGLALLLGAVLRFLKSKSGIERRKSFGTIIFTICFAAVLIAFYTMRGAGMMDYRKTVVLALLWIAWMAGGAERGNI